jgi:hypothetical protein
MAALDGATKSLMQGVSQQVPRERLDGQVSLQSNMLSDVVEGMRRRPGMRWLASEIFASGGITKDRVFATAVDIEDVSVHVLINLVNGNIRIYSETWNLLNEFVYPYLVAPDASAIQVCTLRGYMYICNTTVAPAKVVSNVGRQNPDKTGFFFIKTGQFSKAYNLIVTINGVVTTVSYTTPDGTVAGDAAKSTPEYIANQLAIQLAAASIPSNIVGAYGFIQTGSAGVVSIVSDSGSSSVGVSNTAHVALVSDLPARLGAPADGMMVSVGSNPKLSVWYTYDFDTNAWLESGAYNSCTSMTGMPLRMKLDSSYSVEVPVFEGRNAGNDETNEDPTFLTNGITGMSAFQGRLVLLSGSVVSMSASGKPLRMYRSTVTELLVVDPISIFSGAATTANFTHAVQFNKDLLLFSKSVQAVVPSGNAIITPSTAQIVITSSYSCTSKATPVVAGRSLVYFAPRSEKFAAALEMVPSNTTDSQYTTNDATAHIPRYMPGTVRQATASTTSNSMVLVCDGDARTLFLQEYLWSGDEKVQSAWHSWTSPSDIICTWFVRDTIFIGILVSGYMVVVSVDSQAGTTIDGLTRPFSDVFQTVTVTGGTFPIPVSVREPYFFDDRPLQLTYASGTAAGEAIGFTVNTGTWVGTVVRNVPDGVYMLGLKYTSALSPTPPLIRDKDGVVIGTGASTLIRYEFTTKNTGEFNVVVQRNKEVISDGTYSALTYSSQDLILDAPLFAETGRVVVPVRINSNDANVTLSADDDHDLGVLTAEWVMQYHQHRRRA